MGGGRRRPPPPPAPRLASRCVCAVACGWLAQAGWWVASLFGLPDSSWIVEWAKPHILPRFYRTGGRRWAFKAGENGPRASILRTTSGGRRPPGRRRLMNRVRRRGEAGRLPLAHVVALIGVTRWRSDLGKRLATRVLCMHG